MKALQLQSIGNMQLVDIPVPSPAPDQLLLKTGAAVICTSDLNDLRSNPFHIPLPVIFGHEGAGTVAQIGAEATAFAVGDRVATNPVHPCFHCENCKAGMPHLCANMGHFGLNMQGTFAEYFLVRQDRARKAPQNCDFANAALAEPVCVCIEALEQARLTPRSNLLILGDGAFGVLISLLARSYNLPQIMLAGEHDFRLNFAAGCQTLNLMNVKDRLAALQQAAPAGFDAVILAVGSEIAAQQALAVLKPKGRLIIFSALHHPVPLDLFTLHLKELEILGACNDNDRMDQAMPLLFRPDLALGRLITHRFKLEDFPHAFTTAATAHDKALKVAFEF
jgi:threonine dehydrogenase-like Zn-dependent dehydrogenase